MFHKMSVNKQIQCTYIMCTIYLANLLVKFIHHLSFFARVVPYNTVKMRTRANGPVSPPCTSPTPPPLPDTVTIRKRRRESAPAFLHPKDEPSAPSSPTTPRRNKRVRFSEPGRLALDTGLTPGLRLSTLSPRVIKTPRSTKRRASRLSNLLSPPTTPVEILQFTPLRHGLDERLRRRLSRNHLSEEQNDLHNEESLADKAINVAERLRQETMEKDQVIRQLEMELEIERQNRIQLGQEEDETCQRMRAEITRLQAERNEGHASYTAGVLPSSEMDVDTGLDSWIDDDDDWAEDFIMDLPSSGQSDIRVNFEDMTADVNNIARESATHDAACQASLSDKLRAETVAMLQNTIDRLTDNNTELKATLANIHTQLVGLGFNADEDPRTIISSIDSLLRTARLELEHIYPGETTLSLSAGKDLLLTLLDHIKNLVSDLDESRKATASAEATASTVRANFDIALARNELSEAELAKVCEERTKEVQKAERYKCIIDELTDKLVNKDKSLDTAAQRIALVEKEQKDSAVSIQRLQQALERYRIEASGLEAMLHSTEAEAVNVAAGLRQAQEQITCYEARIRELEHLGDSAMFTYAEQISQLQNGIDTLRREALIQQGRYEERLQQAQSAVEVQVNECKGAMQLLEDALVQKQMTDEENLQLRQEMVEASHYHDQQLLMLSSMFNEGLKKCDELVEAKKRDSGVGMDGDDAVMSTV